MVGGVSYGDDFSQTRSFLWSVVPQSASVVVISQTCQIAEKSVKSR